MARRAVPLAGRLAALAAFSLGGCAGDELAPDAADVGTEQEAIVSGRLTTDLPTSGMLLLGGVPDLAFLHCSATLIGCDKVLTAAHCVCDSFGPACQSTIPALPYFVFFQHAGFFRVQSVEVHPDYDNQAQHDAAVLTLVEPVTGIAPMPMAAAQVPVGTPATIAGFGRVGGNEFVYGIKRRGDIVTAACDEDQGEGKLCWRFDGLPGSSESNACHGDSGGSTFVERDGRLELAGVHSTTSQIDCLADPDNGTTADTAVFEHRAFLVARAPDPAPARCSELPQIGEAGAVSTVHSGQLSLGDGVDTMVDVPPGTAELRVAMNSSDGIDANFNLYVMAGATAGPGRYDCAAAGSGPHGFCLIPSPAPGEWFVNVTASRDGPAARGGEYQLVTTTFDGAPIAHDDHYRVDGPIFSIGPSAGVLINDEEAGRPGLSAVLDNPPRHGKVDLAPAGGFRYAPNQGYAGQDAFRYRASDGAYSGVATVELEIRPGKPVDLAGPPHAGCAAGRRGDGAAGALIMLLAACLGLRRRARR